MRRLSKSIAVVVMLAGVVAVAGGQSASDKPSLLRWKFSKGQELQYQLVVDITAAALGQNSTMTWDMTWHVDSIDNDGAAISYTIDRWRTRVLSGGQAPFDIDSAKPNGDDEFSKRLAPLFEATIGKPGRLIISPRGKISDVELPEGMADKLKSSPSLGPMSQMFNESVVKQMIESIGLELPEKAVSAGASWTQSREINVPGFGTPTVKTTFAFEGIENRGGRRLAKMTPKVEYTLPGEKAVEVTDQESSGSIYFDVGSGRMTQSDVEHTIKFSVELMGQKYNQEVGTVSSLKFTSAGADTKSSSANESKPSSGKESKPGKTKPK